MPVHTFGEPQGVKLQGGIFEMVTREVEIECLPSEIPGEFRVDISELMIGKHLRAGDLPHDHDKMRLVTDPQRVIAHVVALRAEEEKPAEAVAAEAAAPAEPEVIKKGKKEAEEGEEGAAEGEAREEEVAGVGSDRWRYCRPRRWLRCCKVFWRVACDVADCGAGQSGVEYAWTPHNLGFLAVDAIAERAGFAWSGRKRSRWSASAEWPGRKWRWPSRRR